MSFKSRTDNIVRRLPVHALIFFVVHSHEKLSRSVLLHTGIHANNANDNDNVLNSYVMSFLAREFQLPEANRTHRSSGMDFLFPQNMSLLSTSSLRKPLTATSLFSTVTRGVPDFMQWLLRIQATVSNEASREDEPPYHENGQREQEADGEAVVVEWIFPRLHGVVLEADGLVLLVFAQFFVPKENHAHGELFQPDDGANEPGRAHRTKGGEPAGRREVRRVEGKGVLKTPTLCVFRRTLSPQRMDHSQVAVQTDAAQEADADVDVLVEQEAAQLTQPLPVLPVVILERTGRQVRDRWVKVESVHIKIQLVRDLVVSEDNHPIIQSSGTPNAGREPAHLQEITPRHPD